VICMKKIGLLCGALVFLLAGCGQKGPLYLPQSATPSSNAPKAAPAAPSKQVPAVDSNQQDSTDTKAPNAQDFNAQDLENEDSKAKRTNN